MGERSHPQNSSQNTSEVRQRNHRQQRRYVLKRCFILDLARDDIADFICFQVVHVKRFKNAFLHKFNWVLEFQQENPVAFIIQPITILIQRGRIPPASRSCFIYDSCTTCLRYTVKIHKVYILRWMRAQISRRRQKHRYSNDVAYLVRRLAWKLACGRFSWPPLKHKTMLWLCELFKSKHHQRTENSLNENVAAQYNMYCGRHRSWQLNASSL